MLFGNRNLCTIQAATVKHLEIGHKSDVTTIAMAMAIQVGGYFGFKSVFKRTLLCFPK